MAEGRREGDGGRCHRAVKKTVGGAERKTVGGEERKTVEGWERREEGNGRCRRAAEDEQ